MQEERGPVVELSHAFGLALQQFQRGERCRSCGRRHPHRKHEAGCNELQIIDELLAPGNVAAAGHQALAERPHPNVDLLRLDTEPVCRAKAPRPQHAQRMRFVDHQPGAMAPRNADKGRQIRDIAIHAVMPLDNEERAPIARTRFAEQPIRGFVVEMWKWHATRPGEHRPLNNAVVDQRVVDDHVIAAEQMADNGDIGRMPADKDDAVVSAVNLGQRLFELSVNRAFA